MRLLALLLPFLLGSCAIAAALGTGAGGSIIGAIVLPIFEGAFEEVGAKAVDATAPDIEAYFESVAAPYKESAK